MTEKRFKFDRDTVATNLKTPIVYDEERMSIGEVLDKLNELHEENKGIQNKVFKLIEWLETEKGVSRKEIKEWWRYEYRVEVLEEENKELQERNDRQAKQLDDICRLIEQKDWRALMDVLDDFKRNDKQLQSEW